MLGREVPEFSLDASNGNTIRISQLRSHFVLLVFYPMNDSPSCNRQLDAINHNAEEFFRRGVRVFGVNTASIEKHAAYCKRRLLDFPLLSDPGGKVARLFRARIRLLALNRRTVVLVSPQGTICFYRRGTPAPEEILKTIDGWAR